MHPSVDKPSRPLDSCLSADAVRFSSSYLSLPGSAGRELGSNLASFFRLSYIHFVNVYRAHVCAGDGASLSSRGSDGDSSSSRDPLGNTLLSEEATLGQLSNTFTFPGGAQAMLQLGFVCLPDTVHGLFPRLTDAPGRWIRVEPL